MPRARRATEPEPAWEVAYLFPPQGQWTEDEYLALSTNRTVELSNGRLEVPQFPTTSHQGILGHVALLLWSFVNAHDLGLAIFGPLPVRLWEGTIREPDVLFMHKHHANRMGEEIWKGADLVMEVVGPHKEDRERDLETKPPEYARAGIPEYWIIDPQEEKVTVLRLADKEYAVHGVFAPGTQATSALLPGFSVDVTEALSQQLPRQARKPSRKGKRPRS